MPLKVNSNVAIVENDCMNKIFYKKETCIQKQKYELLEKKYTNWNTCCGQIVFVLIFFLTRVIFPLLHKFGILSKSDALNEISIGKPMLVCFK